ncbi:MAG TPA: DUF1330 domain-containing protein [Candidatus Deferrimicrobiaceae bacterium]|nr:DUF1330 domain-containing protein [Candidatus Deferrimicrobiaceae bacterium]
MPAYLISDITLRDREAFETYRTRAANAIHQYGGRYLARLGEVQVLEGSWNPNMIVIVEFPSLERAREWYRSPEYAYALEVHDKALSRNLIFVDGLKDSTEVINQSERRIAK